MFVSEFIRLLQINIQNRHDPGIQFVRFNCILKSYSFENIFESKNPKFHVLSGMLFKSKQKAEIKNENK